MERRGWPSCLRDDLTVMVMMAGLVGKDLTPRQQQQILDVQLTPHVDNTCARLNNALQRSARTQKPVPCRWIQRCVSRQLREGWLCLHTLCTAAMVRKDTATARLSREACCIISTYVPKIL